MWKLGETVLAREDEEVVVEKDAVHAAFLNAMKSNPSICGTLPGTTLNFPKNLSKTRLTQNLNTMFGDEAFNSEKRTQGSSSGARAYGFSPLGRLRDEFATRVPDDVAFFDTDK